MCDLDQRSRPKALGREAGVSHRLCLVLPGPSMPPLLSSIAGIQWVCRDFAELTPPAQGREPPFQWPSLTSTLKQALTGMGQQCGREALSQLWEGTRWWRALPQCRSVTDVLLVSCRCVAALLVDLKSFTIIT